MNWHQRSRKGAHLYSSMIPKSNGDCTTLSFWKTIGQWLLIPILVAYLLNQTIVRDYKIDASWHRVWKVEGMDGKITLTPTHPEPPANTSEIPN